MRKAVFAGSFYPSNGEAIISFFKNVKCLTPKKDAVAAIVPHAGYIYSGKTAFKTLCSVNIPETVVVFCPNHRGLGWHLAVSSEDRWETPLGDVEVDVELSREIAEFKYAKLDDVAHLYEHSLEVQLPILKILKPDAKIVAVSVATYNTSLLRDFAIHIAEKTKNKDVLFVASSDMSHYVPADYAKKMDFMVIEALKKLDADTAFEVVEKYDISMCGILPAYVAVNIAKIKGAQKGEVIEYTNSGEATGDFNNVVAYLGMIFM